MLSGISPWSILLILIIVVLLFGTKKLRNVGSDLGSAIKSFKKSSREEPSSPITKISCSLYPPAPGFPSGIIIIGSIETTIFFFNTVSISSLSSNPASLP